MQDSAILDELHRGLPPPRVVPDAVARMCLLLDDGPRVYNALQRKRHASGLSQDELAAAAGVSRQTISSLENQRTTPSVRLALAIAAVLEATVEDLFGDATANVSRTAPPPPPHWDPAAGAARATCSRPAACPPASG
jgi:putative transcriptional regulator